MSLTFLQMQTLASDYLDDPNNGYFSLTNLKTRLNLASKELQKRLLLAASQYYVECVTTATVSGQQAYALPSDFLELVRLDFLTSGSGATANYQKILSMTPNQRDLLSDVSGRPAYYWLQNNNIMLAPIPDSVYTLHLEYAYLIADMVNDSDVLDAPAQFHEYPVLLTVRDCMVKDMRPLGNIETKLKEYEELLKQFAPERQVDGARMVVSSETMDW
jgi:hypothetical protein